MGLAHTACCTHARCCRAWCWAAGAHARHDGTPGMQDPSSKPTTTVVAALSRRSCRARGLALTVISYTTLSCSGDAPDAATHKQSVVCHLPIDHAGRIAYRPAHRHRCALSSLSSPCELYVWRVQHHSVTESQTATACPHQAYSAPPPWPPAICLPAARPGMRWAGLPAGSAAICWAGAGKRTRIGERSGTSPARLQAMAHS